MSGTDASETWVVSNEFAAVTLRKVRTRNGERLEIRSIAHEHAILLDAITLEALTWSTPLEVGKGLETPFGPDPTDHTDTGGTADPDDDTFDTTNDERDA